MSIHTRVPTGVLGAAILGATARPGLKTLARSKEAFYIRQKKSHYSSSSFYKTPKPNHGLEEQQQQTDTKQQKDEKERPDINIKYNTAGPGSSPPGFRNVPKRKWVPVFENGPINEAGGELVPVWF